KTGVQDVNLTFDADNVHSLWLGNEGVAGTDFINDVANDAIDKIAQPMTIAARTGIGSSVDGDIVTLSTSGTNARTAYSYLSLNQSPTSNMLIELPDEGKLFKFTVVARMSSVLHYININVGHWLPPQEHYPREANVWETFVFYATSTGNDTHSLQFKTST
ncbi:hypothetical protein DRQ29_05490, partial [bacterium]